jgi:hypothetical protein
VADQSLVATEAENQQSACETELQQAQLQGEHSADVETIDELITEADDPPADVGDDADDAAAGVFDEDVVPATPVDLGPLEFSMAPSELCYLAQWVLTSQLKKLPNMTADAAGFAAADIAKKFAQLLQQRQSSSPEQPSPGPPAAGGAQAATVEDGQQQAATQQQQEDEPAAERGRTLLQSVTVLPHQFEQLKSAMRNKLDRSALEQGSLMCTFFMSGSLHGDAILCSRSVFVAKISCILHARYDGVFYCMKFVNQKLPSTSTCALPFA